MQALRLERSPESLPDSNLVHELGIDSINSLELLVWVENEFDIQIQDSDLSVDLVDSLDTLAGYVDGCVARKSSAAAASPAHP